MASRVPLLTVLLVLLLPDVVRAQFFSYEREAPRVTQSICAVYSAIEFNYAGGEDPELRFDYASAAYGLQYARPSFQISALFGESVPESRPEAEKLQLIEASLFTWGEIQLSARGDHRTRFYIPILLHSSHRRVAGASSPALSSVSAFSVTVVGIGTGAGFSTRLNKLLIEARATPVIGFATRSFGDATGSSHLFDGDLLVHLGRLAGPLGLSVGYGFRAQAWNVGSSNLLVDEVDDLFDYRGHHHAIRVGVNW